MENIANVFIYLELRGEKIEFEKLNKISTQLDCFSAKKGDKYFINKNGVKIFEIRDENYWQIRIEYHGITSEGLEEKIFCFLEDYIAVDDALIDCVRKCKANIWCSVYPEETQYNLMLSKKVMAKLLELDLNIGFTILQLNELTDC